MEQTSQPSTQMPNMPTPPEVRPTPPNNPMMPPKRESSIGPIVGIIIVIAVLLVGALYFWGQHLSKLEQKGVQGEQTTEDTSSVGTVSDSDDLGTIEAELGATAIESFDWVFEEVNYELSGSDSN